MNIDVFISHHTDSSLHIVEAIANKLESNGIRCWYAPRNTQGAYASSIAQAINSCKVFLLILNKPASESVHVLNELNMITNRLSRKEDVSVIPFHTADDDISDDAQYYLGRLHWIDAITPPIEERILDLFQMILTTLKRSPNDCEITEHSVKNVLHSTPFVKNQGFVGRECELSQIDQILKEDRVVFISGIGGTGKTELVNQYVNKYQNEYKTIIITKYESSLTDVIISEKYFSIEGIERNQMESDHDFALRKLAKIKELSDTDTLIVIDNFDTSEDTLLDEILHGPYQILFTTRMNFDYLGVPVMALGELEHVKQIELFKKNYKRPLNAQQMPLLEELLQLIQGHTLTIELIARLMATKHVKMEVMLDQLKQVGISPALTGSVHHKTTRAQTVYSHIEALFDLESLSGEELLVMQNLSLMPLAGVSFGDFMEWCHYEDGETINNLIERSWIKYNVEQDLISLHPVIADIVRSKTESFVKSCKTMLDSLSGRFRCAWEMEYQSRIEYGEIAKAIYYRISDITVESYNLHRFIYSIFFNLEYTDLAIQLITSMECVFENQMSVEQAWVYYHIYEFYKRKRDYERCLAYIERVIEITRKVFPESLDLSFFLVQLARAYNSMFESKIVGKKHLEKSFNLLEEAERIDPSCSTEVKIQISSTYSFGIEFDRIHEDQIASRLYAFAQNCYLNQKYEEALKYALLSCRRYLILYEGLSAAIASPLTIFAKTYSKLGNYSVAVKTQNAIIKIQKEYWSTDHYLFWGSVETLADIYFEHGKVDEGLAQLYYILECLANKQDYYINYIQKINEKIQQYERA